MLSHCHRAEAAEHVEDRSRGGGHTASRTTFRCSECGERCAVLLTGTVLCADGGDLVLWEAGATDLIGEAFWGAMEAAGSGWMRPVLGEFEDTGLDDAAGHG